MKQATSPSHCQNVLQRSSYLRLGLNLGLDDIDWARDAVRGSGADTTGNEVAVVEALQGRLDSCVGGRCSCTGIGGYCYWRRRHEQGSARDGERREEATHLGLRIWVVVVWVVVCAVVKRQCLSIVSHRASMHTEARSPVGVGIESYM